MKILQVNCVYNKGSTGKMVYDIHQSLLNQGHQSLVCYGRGNQTDHPFVYKISSECEAKIHSVLSRVTGLEFAFSPLATQRLIRLIQKEKPHVVHLHCLNGHFLNVYKTLKFLKAHHIPTVLTLHAEIMHTAGCEHARECERWREHCYRCNRVGGKIAPHFIDVVSIAFDKMDEALKGFSALTVVGVSDWLTNRVRQSALMKGLPCVTIKNGVDTDVFCPTECKDLRHRLNVLPGKVVLHVTPNFRHPIKGGKYVLELAERMPECQFIIVGFHGDTGSLPSNVIGISHTNNQYELAQYYTMADLTLLTSERETFSMVCAESLCCGTPVVGFQAGAPETICPPEYSEFVEQGNVDALIIALRKWLYHSFDKNQLIQLAQWEFSKDTMCDEYITLYRNH